MTIYWEFNNFYYSIAMQMFWVFFINFLSGPQTGITDYLDAVAVDDGITWYEYKNSQQSSFEKINIKGNILYKHGA